MLRGLARLEAKLPEAINDFRQAVQLGVASMWPYYFLAWDALHQGRYPEVLLMCNLALSRPDGTNREKADLYDWWGIALAESGQSLDWAIHNFREAAALAPDN